MKIISDGYLILFTRVFFNFSGILREELHFEEVIVQGNRMEEVEKVDQGRFIGQTSQQEPF